MNRRVTAASLIVLAFIVLAVIDGDDSEQADGNGLDLHLRADYDYYINDMMLDRFGPDDTHAYTLQARRVTHYPAGDLSQLDAPILDWYGGGQGPWELEAKRGTMQPVTMQPTAAGDEYAMVLQEDVHASTTLQDGRPLDMYTSSLELVPASKSAHTADPVRIENGNLQMRGTGMQIDMNERRVRLLADVRARHEPPATP